MESKFKTYPETAPFVEALQAVLLAEAKTLTGFSDIYGDTFSKDGGKTGGEDMFHRSGLSDLFAEAKETLKTWIGTTFELGMSGLLEAPGDPSLTGKKRED
jgi:hypothetical protein